MNEDNVARGPRELTPPRSAMRSTKLGIAGQCLGIKPADTFSFRAVRTIVHIVVCAGRPGRNGG